MEVLEKNRPCVIIQSDKINEPKQGTYLIAPIRTEHSLEVTRETISDIVEQKRKLGRIYVPIEMEPDRFSFIDITRITTIQSSDILSYKNSIINPEVKKKINRALYELMFAGDEYACVETNVEDKKETIQVPEKDNNHSITDSQIILLDTSSISKNTEMGEKISATIENNEKFTAKLPKNFNEIYVKVKNGRMTTQKASIELGMDVYSFNKLMQDYEKSKLSNNTNKGSDEVKEKSKYTKYSKTAIPSGFSLYYKKYKNKEMTVKQIAERLGKHVSTVYSYIYRYEELQVAK